MVVRGTKEWTKNFIIWLDNGRWEPRSYLQPDGSWGEDPSTAADFAKRADAYVFARQFALDANGYRNERLWSRIHAGHRWY